MIQRLTSPVPAERLARLAAAHRAAFAPTSRGWSSGEIADLAKTGALFADGADRGFALFALAADEAEVLTIAVRPDHRRKGLARALFTAARGELARQGAARIFLEVAADNHAAIALYAAVGFDRTGRRPGYYRRPDGARVDALTMMIDL